MVSTGGGGTRERQALVIPSGSDADAIELPMLVAHGAADGPRALVLGGVHGDEPEGISAASAVWRDIDLQDLHGTLVVLPMANPPAWEHGTRVSGIDGLNLARTFPGRADGSVTERIAWAITHLIRDADVLIDLHSAGLHYTMPFLAGAYAAADDLGERCTAAALAFGAPVFWAHPDLAPGRSLSVAAEAGIVNLYVECGGDIDTWLTAAHAGLLLEHVKVLDQVHAGDLLGTIIDPWDGAEKQRLHAPFGGVVVTARRTARVQAGDGTYMIALPEAD